jgi:hypothetical protein
VLRAFLVHRSNERNSYSYASEKAAAPDIVAVIDTETTNDTFLSLKFGSFGTWVAGRLHRFIIFYSDNLPETEDQVLRAFAGKQIESVSTEVMPLSRFIDNVFYRVVYDSHARLVGFNLPFDLSRLTTHYGLGRRKWKGGFTFTPSKNSFRPPIRIKSLDSTKAFIEFASPPRRNQRHPKPHHKGRFLDLHTLGFALTDRPKLSLDAACILFHVDRRKIHVSEHGKVTPQYIDYNVNDTLITYDLYLKMIERYDSFHLTLLPEKAYSPASIGKQYLKQMGVKPFLEQNPKFLPEVLGYIMTTYFGGRSEVRIRKKPVKVRYMDFASMYPSLFSLIGLWPFLTAERIECVEATKEIRRLVEKADLQTLRDPVVWQQMVAIVQIQPDDDTLPARAPYGDKRVYNIGINHLTSPKPLLFTLVDVLASKLLTGKSPKILRAIKFVPQGRQSGLVPTPIVGGSTVNPDEDLFLKLRQLRTKTKKEREQQPTGSPEHQRLDTVQNELKIIANAASYGIFIEINPEDSKCEADAYGLEHFKCKASKKEKFGRFFHPLISTMLTSGARLLLAMAETWLQQHGGYYAFCDTDSMAVSPFHWNKLQEYFEPLNPMPGEPFLKLEVENYDERHELRELWFYGISAKRYVLYRLVNGEPSIVEDGWSSHGLGHLMHEKESGWEKQLWTNILRYALGKISKEQLLEQYADDYAIAELTVTKPHLLRRVKTLNKGSRPDKQIKPYNFVLVGSPTMVSKNGEPIIPLTQFTSEYGQAPYQPFIDAKSGRLYEENTELYWKKLDKTVGDYIDHPENKFENGQRYGTMRRRHSVADSILYIGKEANELEESEILGVDDETYVEYRKSQ